MLYLSNAPFNSLFNQWTDTDNQISFLTASYKAFVLIKNLFELMLMGKEILFL